MDTIDQIDADRILELEQLALEDAKLKEQEEAVKERRAQIRAIFSKELTDGSHKIGEATVIITRPQRIDTKAIAEAHPFTEAPELYEAAINLANIKQHFSPAQLEQFKKAGSRQVTIR